MTPAPIEWYDLFSRGARDWLRHNDKVRESVREALPDIIKSGDVIVGDTKTVRVPVKMLEHYHFRLADTDERQGVGQGDGVKPGDQFGPSDDGQKGAGGEGGGSIQLELKVDDIVDWLWEELKLPNLKPREGTSTEDELVREGLSETGPRARLDRRASLRRWIKRQAVPNTQPTLINDDLRYRQLRKRPRPVIDAVMFCLMDVSGSMSDRDRQKAKSFFFWASQGLRRQYRTLQIVFVAHATEAQEFEEHQFFAVTGEGGTITSSGLKKVREILDERYNPERTNCYLFYVSDGDNAISDRGEASSWLTGLMDKLSYAGYVEVATTTRVESEIRTIWSEQTTAGKPASWFEVVADEHVYEAIRHFFTEEQTDA